MPTRQHHVAALLASKATMNAVNAPIARQSRSVRGWKKLAAKTTNNAVFNTTSGHSP